MSAATSVMLATQNGSNISSNFTLIISMIMLSVIIYLSVATIYYGGQKTEKNIHKKKKILDFKWK